MSPPRIPGPKGIHGYEKVDSGTLARNSTAPPGIITSAKAKEGVSWSAAIKRAHAYTDTDGLTFAEIYFATDDDKVHSDDILAMNNLINSIPRLLKDGFKLRLLCTGEADYRAPFKYNIDLGMRRANSVKSLIDSRTSNKALEVRAKSIGESKALQPKHGKRPSLMEIMNDRKVVITIGNKGLTPPVTLSVTGNWIHNSNIEKTEINNGGRIVAPYSSEDNKKEREYKGLEHDPILTLVLIKTHYSIKKINNKDEAYIECNVVHQLNNRMLFTASDQTDDGKNLKEYVHYDPKNPKVKRKIFPGTTVPKGHVVEERIATGVNERAQMLFEPIYAQLKGKYRNITERVEAVSAHQ